WRDAAGDRRRRRRRAARRLGACDHRGGVMAAPAQAGLPTARLEELYRRMAVIRAFEIRSMAMFGEKLIRGSVHPYVGQEAIAVGVCDTLTEADLITSTHRGHGHCIAKGLDPKLMMAEITGRETGYCRGKGGS